MGKTGTTHSMFAWVRRGKAIMHTYIRLVALSTEEPQDTVFVLDSLSSVAVMSDMYAWNDLCGSREIGVKSQAMCTAAGFSPLLPRMGVSVLVTDGGATCGSGHRLHDNVVAGSEGSYDAIGRVTALVLCLP